MALWPNFSTAWAIATELSAGPNAASGKNAMTLPLFDSARFDSFLANFRAALFTGFRPALFDAGTIAVSSPPKHGNVTALLGSRSRFWKKPLALRPDHAAPRISKVPQEGLPYSDISPARCRRLLPSPAGWGS